MESWSAATRVTYFRIISVTNTEQTRTTWLHRKNTITQEQQGDQSFYQPTLRGNLETFKISSSELA